MGAMKDALFLMMDWLHDHHYEISEVRVDLNEETFSVTLNGVLEDASEDDESDRS